MTLSRRTILESIGAAATVGAASGSAAGARGRALQTGTQENLAGVSMAHYSPNMPNVDFYVNDQLVAEAVGYGEFTGYVELEAGTHTVTVTGADDAVPQVQYQFDFQPGYYTVALIGTLPDSLELMGVFESSLDFELPDDGRTHVAMAHASPDSPSFDVILNGETVLFEDLAYGTATLYKDIAAGTATIEFVPVDETSAEVTQEPIQVGQPVAEGDSVSDPEAVDSGEQSPIAEPTDPNIADSTDPEVIESSEPTATEPGAAFEFDFESGTAYTGWLIGYADPTEPPERQLELPFTIDAVASDSSF